MSQRVKPCGSPQRAKRMEVQIRKMRKIYPERIVAKKLDLNLDEVRKVLRKP